MWDIGLSVRDWRYVVRIANIDNSDLVAGTIPIYDHMRRAYYQLHQRRVVGGRASIYCNRDALESLDRIAHNQGSTDNFTRLLPHRRAGTEPRPLQVAIICGEKNRHLHRKVALSHSWIPRANLLRVFRFGKKEIRGNPPQDRNDSDFRFPRNRGNNTPRRRIPIFSGPKR